ncbi:MAG: type II toxin-antitoxin system MqsA family antitoxin [Dehalococcoidia bacterium]|nr:type II toxin-antitoxin system MqsA family antitoxin [Dehalococcoidia bacterium]
MTGKPARYSRCPLCGGRMTLGMVTVPFVLRGMVVVKDVPAEVCHSCDEPYMTGKVTDRLTDLLNQLRVFRPEFSAISATVPAAVAE